MTLAFCELGDFYRQAQCMESGSAESAVFDTYCLTVYRPQILAPGSGQSEPTPSSEILRRLVASTTAMPSFSELRVPHNDATWQHHQLRMSSVDRLQQDSFWSCWGNMYI
mmetsp:Transcript_96419/g.210847  ORF Transcript_96419/g.210847 Transcript_96419/m.210847 type:complete len:110 (-) Transcript_96419:38-367(-)